MPVPALPVRPGPALAAAERAPDGPPKAPGIWTADKTATPNASAARLGSRQRAGAQLLLNKQISVAGQAWRQLADGLVDARLLMTLAVLARMHPLRIVTFIGSGPGAGGDVPLPIVQLTGAGHDTGIGYLEQFVTFLRAQRPPFLAASARTEQLANGRPGLRIAFADPVPLGLLTAGNTALPNINRK